MAQQTTPHTRTPDRTHLLERTAAHALADVLRTTAFTRDHKQRRARELAAILENQLYETRDSTAKVTVSTDEYDRTHLLHPLLFPADEFEPEHADTLKQSLFTADV